MFSVIVCVLGVLAACEGVPRTNGHQSVSFEFENHKAPVGMPSRTRKQIFSFKNPYAAKGTLSNNGFKTSNTFSYSAARRGYPAPVVPAQKPAQNKPNSRVDGLYSVERILQKNIGLLHSIENLIVDAIMGSEIEKPIKPAVKPQKKIVVAKQSPGVAIKKKVNDVKAQLNKKLIEKVLSKPVVVHEQKPNKIEIPVTKTTTKVASKKTTTTSPEMTEKEQPSPVDPETALGKDLIQSNLTVNTQVKKTTTTEPTDAQIEPTEAPEIPTTTPYYGEQYRADEYCACLPSCPSGTTYRGHCGQQWSYGSRGSICCINTMDAFFADEDDDDR